MKKIRVSVAALMLGAGALLMSSCIGKFGLVNKIFTWNQTVTNSKWVNWLVFLGLNIVPVYEFSYFLDLWLFNSLEFWTGNNPMAGVDMNVQGERGEYHVKSTENGYRVEHLASGEIAEFVFDSATQTWSVESNGQSVQLVQFVDDNAKVFFGEQELVFNAASTSRLLAQQ